MTTVAAIDGGKSGLRIRISGPQGEVSGTGPGFVYGRAAYDIPAIVAAVESARAHARATAPGAFDDTIDVACLGLTGIPGEPAERAELVRELRRTLSAGILLLDDAILAHAGALAGPGTVVSAGTGTIVLGIGDDGVPHWADAWGPILGDRGSAYAIGHAGMRAAAAALDGVGPATMLAQSFTEALGGDTSLAALQRFYRSDSTVVTISDFAVVVLSAAQSGDQVSAVIIGGAAEDLAATVSTVEALAPGHPVSHAGRLLGVGSAFRVFLDDAFERRGITLAPPRGDALDGGILLARGAAQRDRDDPTYQQAMRAWESETS